MNNVFKFVSAVLIVFVVSGCSNSYSKFYTSYASVGQDMSFLEPLNGEPKIVDIINSKSVADEYRQHMYENGYVELGVSRFEDKDIGDRGLIAHAKEIGAHTVIRYKQYVGTNTASMPITSPSTSTINHNGSVYGNGGYASYSGTSIVNSSVTSYVPININRYSYGAQFWGKLKNVGFGLYFRELNDSERHILDSNKGVTIEYVIKGSPGFNADLMRNDIIKSVNGVSISSASEINDILGKLRVGKDFVDFVIVRNGDVKYVKVM